MNAPEIVGPQGRTGVLRGELAFYGWVMKRCHQWLGSPAFISHGVRLFGNGGWQPDPERGIILTMCQQKPLKRYVLGAHPPSSTWKTKETGNTWV